MTYGTRRFNSAFSRAHMLTVYGVSHYLLLEGVHKYFPFTVDKTQNYFSYLSVAFREKIKMK